MSLILTVNLIGQKPTPSDINKIIKSPKLQTKPPDQMVSLQNLLRCQPILTVIYLISLPATYLKTNIPSTQKQLQQDHFLKKYDKIKNYRPANLLNIFSKIYERFLHENLTNYVNSFHSKFISACRKSYSFNHVLIRLIENWKIYSDEKTLLVLF